MPLDHNTAAATIEVFGLALGCYNPATKNWEVGFIVEPRHMLCLHVFKRPIGGGADVHIPLRPITLDARNSIFIGATDAVAQTPFHTGGHDPEDFDLILDIEKEVYGAPIDLKRPNPHGVIQLTVSNPTLFSVNGKLSRTKVKLIVKDDVNETPVKRFGRIGTAAGADIRGADGSVIVRVTGPGGFEETLPSEPGFRYIIILDNMCPVDLSHLDTRAESAPPDHVSGIDKLSGTGHRTAPHSDFVHYYSVLDPKQLGFFDLKADTDERGDEAVCNYSHLGLREQMFPLP